MDDTLLVDAGGGRRLAVRVAGRGEPLVLLEVGLGAESTSWTAVAQGVASFTRVAFYDRAGRGASDPATKPRNLPDLVEDARRVVAALAPAQPVVLVGQSLGGLIARSYAHRHPHEVAGLVLVDSLHEDQFEHCSPLFPPAVEGEPPSLTGMRAFWSGGWREPSRNPEGIDLPACQQAARAITSLGRLPLRVLTATGFTLPAAGFGAAGPKLQATWDALQAQLAALSSDARRDVLAGTGHFVQSERPELIVEAIRELVAAARG